MRRYRNAIRSIKATLRNHEAIYEHEGIHYRCPSCGEEIGHDDYSTYTWNTSRAYFHKDCLTAPGWNATCFICDHELLNSAVKHPWGHAHAECLIEKLVFTFAVRDNVLEEFNLHTRTPYRTVRNWLYRKE